VAAQAFERSACNRGEHRHVEAGRGESGEQRDVIAQVLVLGIREGELKISAGVVLEPALEPDHVAGIGHRELLQHDGVVDDE
jgi:hypothetical protein